MAKGSIGKQVARAAATGGGRTTRGEIPIGFYGTLALISVAGIFVVGYSRYELQHPVTKPVVHPVIGDNWNFAFGVYDCKSFLSDLPKLTAPSKAAFSTTGNGIINLSPKVSADEGKGATLGKFASDYKGLKFTASSVTYPGKGTVSAGALCNGKPVQLETSVWTSLLDTHPKTYTGNPANVAITANDELVTVGFVPKGVALPKPASASQLANVTTTTTAAPATTTTVPSKSTKTTSKSVTTTTKASATTTTKPGG